MPHMLTMLSQQKGQSDVRTHAAEKRTERHWAAVYGQASELYVLNHESAYDMPAPVSRSRRLFSTIVMSRPSPRSAMACRKAE